VVAWNKEIPTFIANSLSPAQVLSVDLINDIATVVVPDKHLSLAIGKDGQNARLAAKLTGWRIDIKSASVAEAEKAAKAAEEEARLRAIREKEAEKAAAEALAAAALRPAPVPAPVVAAPVVVVAPAPEPVIVEKAPPVVEEAEPEPEPVAVAAEIKTKEAKVAREPEKEEAEAATVLSSTFIPRRIIQPREASKTQIRFAEDIFTNRPGRPEDKPRKKKKKFTHSSNKPGANVKGGQPEGDADDEG
jgi:transcription termination/antitermination protein NusA